MLAGKFYESQPVAVREELRAVLRGPSLAIALLADFDFKSGIVRFCNRTVQVVDGRHGHVWRALNATARIEDVEGGPNVLVPVRTYSLDVPRDLARRFDGGLSPIPDLDDKSEYSGRAARTLLQVLEVGGNADGSDRAVGYPVVMHAGVMDSLTRSLTREGVRYALSVEGPLTQKAVRGSHFLSQRDQLQRYPGDLGLQYMIETANTLVKWPDY